LEKDIAKRLSEIFAEICLEKGFNLLANSILMDHVHLLIEKKENDRNEYIMKSLKGGSSRLIFNEFPSNRLFHRKLWGRGYRAYEIKDNDQLAQVVKYINNQTINGEDKRFFNVKEAATFSRRLPIKDGETGEAATFSRRLPIKDGETGEAATFSRRLATI